MADDTPPRLPAPPEPPLLPAPEAPLLLAAPQPRPTLLQRSPRATIGIALAVLLLLAFLIGWFMHHRRAEAAEKANREARDQTPLVIAVQARRSAALGEMLLPGSLSPIEEASVYARATGYVSRRLVDIGDAVKKDQLLARIDSPELDQQLLQSDATVAQARQQRDSAVAAIADAQARRDAARVTLARYRTLLAQDSIARQDVDTQQQVTDSAEANLRAAHANVGAAQEGVRAAEADQRRVRALQRYEDVRAPFDGIVTARNVDEGALISGTGAGLVGGSTMSTSAGSGTGGTGTGNAGGSSQSGSGSSSSSDSGNSGGGVEMFHVAQIHRLRVYVNVPQESATRVTAGTPAMVIVQEADSPVVGAVTRTSHALDPSSRTLLAEVQIPNAREQLLPGMFAQVRFTDPRPNAPLMVSGETLITRAKGTQVAILERPTGARRDQLQNSPDARCARQIRLQPVALGRDYGTQVEITRGLREGDFIVLNPGDVVHPGAIVLPQLQPPEEDDATGAGQGGSGRKPGQAGAKPGGEKDDKSKDGKSKDDKSRDGKDKSGKTKDGKGDKDKEGDDEARQRRQQAEQTCLEQQPGAQPAPPSGAPPSGASAASGAASTTGPGSPSDTTPAGIRSPGMQAPTQGQKKSP